MRTSTFYKRITCLNQKITRLIEAIKQYFRLLGILFTDILTYYTRILLIYESQEKFGDTILLSVYHSSCIHNVCIH